ncbi:MAG TPA: PDZ domain-containing protein [Gammaproteobacteria bacterium]|nr:PDZ domain-containing protein [Gammaproteobacteria bacterium]
MKVRNWIVAAMLAGAPMAAMAGTGQVPVTPPNPAQPPDVSAQLEQAQQALQAAAARVAALSLATFDNRFHHGLWQMNMSLGWARLGINVGEPAKDGLSVEAVTPGGAADKAGIQAGDTLQSIAGIPLSAEKDNRHKLADALDNLNPGDRVKVAWAHAGKIRHAELTAQDLFASVRHWADRERDLAKQSAVAAQTVASTLANSMPQYFRFSLPNRWGDMELATLTPQLGQYFGANSGLLVVRAPHDDALQLQDGDVILKIGARQPGSPTQAMRILHSYMPGDTLKLTILRDHKQRELKIKLKPRHEFKVMPVDG